MRGQKLKLRYLKPRKWCDKDEVLIHAMFEVLCRFVEDEKKWIKIINWDTTPDHKQAKKNIDLLYKWWKKRQNRDKLDPLQKPNIPSPIIKSEPCEDKKGFSKMIFDESWENPKWKKACKDHDVFEDQCRKEDTEMMKLLIETRYYLWT
jgi:hypothetical protein